MTAAKTKLLTGRPRHRDDARVVAAIAELPAAQGAPPSNIQRAGIANEDGQVYRLVLASGVFQMLHLTARLNALGFAVSPELRQARVNQYDRIFFKASGRQ